MSYFMVTTIFDSLSRALTEQLGSPSPLDSGNGVRFKSAQKGKATIYHGNIAPGNSAEVAFDVVSMAGRLRMGQEEFRLFVGQLRASTGRPVEPNSQFNWPRVGLASEADVVLIRQALQAKFGPLTSL
jgi:hypothetical protein